MAEVIIELEPNSSVYLRGGWDPEYTNPKLKIDTTRNVVKADGIGWPTSIGCRGFSRGKRYFEISCEDGTWSMIGVAQRRSDVGSKMIGCAPFTWCIYSSETREWDRTKNHAIRKNYPVTKRKVRRVGIYLDMDAKKLYYFQDEKCLGLAFSSLEGTVYPAVSLAIGCRAELIMHPKFFPTPSMITEECVMNDSVAHLEAPSPAKGKWIPVDSSKKKCLTS